MPKRIDPELEARPVRLVTEHQREYPPLTAASAAVARQLGVGTESVRRCVLQAQIDEGTRPRKTSEEHEGINPRSTDDLGVWRRDAEMPHCSGEWKFFTLASPQGEGYLVDATFSYPGPAVGVD